MLRTKKVYDAYKSILYTINSLNKYNEKDRDIAFIKILKGILIKLLLLSSEYNITSIFKEINKISHLLEGESSLNQGNSLMNCLLKCKEYIESILNRKNVLIFSENNYDFQELQNMLEKDGYNMLLEGESNDILADIKDIHPEAIVINNDEKNNRMTLFKAIEEKDILGNIPIFIIGPEDIQCKIDVLSYGAIDYLYKEFNSYELFLKIKNISKLSKSYVENNIYNDVKETKPIVNGNIYTKADKSANHKKNSLLFVDDDKIILSLLTTRYRNKGYEIFSAESGEKALEIFSNNHIDIIITDYYMPNMTGEEFIKRIKQTNNTVKIIFLSGQKNEEYIKRALDLGADDYVEKPFSPIELDLRIKKFIK